MKRILAILLVLCMIFTFFGCEEIPEFPRYPTESTPSEVQQTTDALILEATLSTEYTDPAAGTTAQATQPPETTEAVIIQTQPAGENLVWIPTKGGTKYHKSADCSGMMDPRHVTMETAIAEGFTACKRCYQ